MEHYVEVSNKKRRREFIQLLEENKYKIIQLDREDIISDIFPFVINTEKKTINTMGNVTTAAAAKTSGKLECAEEFIENVLKKDETEIEYFYRKLMEWYKLPFYQMERSIEINFARYLPQIIGIKPCLVLPEFPILDSGNADFAIFSREKNKIKLTLVELKTDYHYGYVIRGNQIGYYGDVNKNGNEIITSILKKRKNNKKYGYLLEKLEDLKLVKCENNKWRINEKIYDEVDKYYIIPNKNIKTRNNKSIIEALTTDSVDEDGKKHGPALRDEKHIIDFKEIIDNHKNEISKQLCELLKDVLEGIK